MYIYPDKNDAITKHIVAEEFDTSYWEDSENLVLKYVFDYLVKDAQPIHMVDIGCGTGRLFGKFAPYVDTIQALEPDPKRFSNSCDEAKNYSGKITVENSDISGLQDDKRFDFALVSHILQHIAPSAVALIISSLYSHMVDGGLVAVTTTHTSSAKDEYTYECVVDGKRISKAITKDTFLESVGNKDGIPACIFADNTVPEMFRDAGFELIMKKYYHYSNHHSIEEDLLIHDSDGTGAIDVLFLFRKSRE